MCKQAARLRLGWSRSGSGQSFVSSASSATLSAGHVISRMKVLASRQQPAVSKRIRREEQAASKLAPHVGVDFLTAAEALKAA